MERIVKPVARMNRDANACMYTEYFKLSEPPFSLTPDPRYLYMSERHREGLAHLFYGVQQKGGFVQLTGEVGCGKTTLSRCLVRQLPPETDVALILNPRLTAIELLSAVCDELRIRYPADTSSIKVLIDALNQHLLESHAQGRKTVLIIDEAQNLDAAVLEQIRLLTNLETSKEKLLQIILIGQPELISLLKRKELRQIAQRITARYHLLPLSRPEISAYIHHRLRVAGRRDPLFTEGAIRSIYRLSGGVPRLVNILCDRALLGAYALDKPKATSVIVRRAGRETRGVLPWHRKYRHAWILASIALLALIAGGTAFLKRERLSFSRRAASPQSAGRAEKPSAKATLPAAKVSAPVPTRSPETLLPPLRPAEPSAAAPASGKLLELLSTSSSSFGDLYSRWGMKFPSGTGELGCKAAQAKGYECLFLTGGWPKLRRLDSPAILEVLLPTGIWKRATITGLNDEAATLMISGRTYAFPLSEIDRVWDGSFIVLWKPPYASPYPLAPGATGDKVAWVRQALDTLDKRVPATAENPVYDDNLRQRVLRFQKERSLIQDGFIGNETLVRLTLALGGPDAPSLSSKGAR